MAVVGRVDAGDRRADILIGGRTIELRVAKCEDPAVGGHRPITTPFSGGSHTDDGLVEPDVARRPVELRVAECEDPAVGGHQPITTTVRGGSHTDDWLVQPHGSGRTMDCLLYTSDAADDLLCVDLGGRRI